MNPNNPVPKHDLDNRSAQLNATDPAFWRARGKSPEESERLAKEASLAAKTAAVK